MEETRRRRFARAAAVPIGLLASGALVFAGSQSAFTATTDTSANTWTAGKVVLKNDGSKTTTQTFETSSATAAFAAGGAGNSNIKPGQSEVKCIVVENSSSLTGPVKFYMKNVSGALNPPGSAALTTQLLVKVELALGNFKNCSGFTGGATIFGDPSGALLTSAPTTYTGGVGTWSPTGDTTNDYATYRFTWTLPDLGATANNAVQGGTAMADFVWEIQNN